MTTYCYKDIKIKQKKFPERFTPLIVYGTLQ